MLVRIFKSVVFLRYSEFLPYTACFINRYNTFFIFSPSFSASILHFMLNSTHGFTHCDSLNCNTRSISFILILDSSKIQCLHTKSTYFSLAKKLGVNFSTSLIGILIMELHFSFDFHFIWG